ncbi:hypothetical protein HC891_14955 [Candidatus Gracilibacteria bacterium]|nr:hypothetical protein [Candidatus Gracilibacteria bacterium]
MTSRTVNDGNGNSYPWSYSYGTAQINSLGTNLGDTLATGAHPNAATLYYNVFLDGDADYDAEAWLVHPTWTTFLGHASVTETDPSGAQTRRFYYQGDAGCTPPTAARGSHSAITGDSCFQQMRDREFLKGREYRVEYLTSGGTELRETATSYRLGAVDYSYAPLSGLWRTFSYVSAVDETARDGATASTQRSEYFYNTSCNWTASLDAYGNLGCERTYERGTLIRQQIHTYATLNSSTHYIVDRPAITTITDASGNYRRIRSASTTATIKAKACSAPAGGGRVNWPSMICRAVPPLRTSRSMAAIQAMAMIAMATRRRRRAMPGRAGYGGRAVPGRRARRAMAVRRTPRRRPTIARLTRSRRAAPMRSTIAKAPATIIGWARSPASAIGMATSPAPRTMSLAAGIPLHGQGTPQIIAPRF